MSKKKFTDGLESLFGSTTIEDKTLQEDSVLIVETKEQPTETLKKKKKKKSGARRSSGKNFTSDLDSLFSGAMSVRVEEGPKKSRSKSDSKAKAPKPVRVRTLNGLDALIRRTVEAGQTEVQAELPVTRKRVTFIFDKEKLHRLKRIAKHEKLYLKDIIGDVVSKWIEEYEKDNGQVE